MKKGFTKGFTLIELIVVITIITVLSSIILFSVNQYVAKGKDSSIEGNMTVLVPSGEAYYNGPGQNSYGQSGGSNFCNSSVVTTAMSQMPKNTNSACPSTAQNPTGLCCRVDDYGQAWAACAKLFATQTAYCVDSRGMKEDSMPASSCNNNLTRCP